MLTFANILCTQLFLSDMSLVLHPLEYKLPKGRALPCSEIETPFPAWHTALEFHKYPLKKLICSFDNHKKWNVIKIYRRKVFIAEGMLPPAPIFMTVIKSSQGTGCIKLLLCRGGWSVAATGWVPEGKRSERHASVGRWLQGPGVDGLNHGTPPSGLTFPEKASVHRLCGCDHSVCSVHFFSQITVISVADASCISPEHRGLEGTWHTRKVWVCILV